MITAISAIPIAAGVLLLVGTAANVMRTLVVPRGLISRLTFTFDRLLLGAFREGARLLPTYEAKDQLLSYEGPVRLIGFLFVWLSLALLGFALVYWPFTGSFPMALASAGSAMFTLGFVPVSGPAPYAIAFVAAASGLIVITLQIAYLPSIYAAFNRRETLVTMLSSRTGQPPWGPEVLARHALIGNLDDLPQFFRDWELWSADLAESHTNYPVLLAFRSPHPMRSWVVALNSVCDAAAIYLALTPMTAPSQANAFIRMGYSALREIASVMHIPFDPDPLPEDPIDITYEQFRDAVAVLDEAGFPRERTVDEAWPQFHGWRINYEHLVYEIADRLVAPPALWSGPRRGLHGLVLPPQRPRHRHPGEDESHVHDAVGH